MMLFTPGLRSAEKAIKMDGQGGYLKDYLLVLEKGSSGNNFDSALDPLLYAQRLEKSDKLGSEKVHGTVNQ
jgi:hypothetical protein